jgi:hypothetical protein
MANDYYDLPSISNSKLTWINPQEDGSPRKYFANDNKLFEKEETRSLEHGKLLHLYYLERDKYATIKADAPDKTTKVGIMIEEIIQRLYSPEYALERQMYTAEGAEDWAFKAGREKAEISSRFSDNTVNGWIKPYLPYIKEREENMDKISLSEKDRNVLESSIYSLENNPRVQPYLYPSDEYEVLNEYTMLRSTVVRRPDTPEIQVELQLKAKLDKVLIHKTEPIIKIIDIKTTKDSIFNFRRTLLYRHYYRQAAFYIDFFRHSSDFINHNIQFFNIVVEKDGLFESGVVEVTNPWIEKGREEYKNLLQRTAFHISTDMWDESFEEYINNGIIPIGEPYQAN